MTEFEAITLHAAVRNATKVGAGIQLTLNMTAPNYTDDMIISFPPSQVYTTDKCTVSVNGNAQKCTVLNRTAILTSNVAGNAVYVIGGLMNYQAFTKSAVYDLINVTIGNPQVRATTAGSTVHISPKLTLGVIALNSISSTSLVLLHATVTTYNISIENKGNIHGFVLEFSEHFYLIASVLNCKVNS